MLYYQLVSLEMFSFEKEKMLLTKHMTIVVHKGKLYQNFKSNSTNMLESIR